MEKITEKTKAIYRNELYEGIGEFLNQETEYDQESGTKGILVHLPEGLVAEVTVTIKNPEKFDIEVERAALAEKIAKATARQEKAAANAADKAAKAQARADAKALKEAEAATAEVEA